MSRWIKEKAARELAGALAGVRQLVVVDYRGLPGVEAVELRQAIGKAGGRIRVVKNSLGQRALREVGQGRLAETLGGMSALVWSHDLVVPLKALFEAQRKGKRIKVCQGAVDGALLGPEELEGLSQLPGRRELLALLAGCLNAPAAQFARTMKEVTAKLVRTLEAVARRGSGP